MGTKKAPLFQAAEGQPYHSIDLRYMPDGMMQVFTHLIGADIERDWGDSDVEIWSNLRPKDFGPVLFRLLMKYLSDRSDAHKLFDELVREAGVEVDSDSWI